MANDGSADYVSLSLSRHSHSLTYREGWIPPIGVMVLPGKSSVFGFGQFHDDHLHCRFHWSDFHWSMNLPDTSDSSDLPDAPTSSDFF